LRASGKAERRDSADDEGDAPQPSDSPRWPSVAPAPQAEGFDRQTDLGGLQRHDSDEGGKRQRPHANAQGRTHYDNE